MCMMLGIDTKEPVRANELMEALYSHGNEHPTGWGLAYLPAGDGVQPTIIREAQNAAVSERVQAILREPVMTAHLIAHIRRASVGSTVLENCHPFEGKDRAGRRWVLAHNGTLFDPRKTVNYLGEREGSTDSEAILPYLMDASNAADAQGLDGEGRLEAIDRAVTALAPGNKLNLLFTDGAHTFAYTNDANKTLWRLRLEDGWAFATAPLDERDWEPMPVCQLLVVRDGSVVFEGQVGEGVFTADEAEYESMIDHMRG